MPRTSLEDDKAFQLHDEGIAQPTAIGELPQLPLIPPDILEVPTYLSLTASTEAEAWAATMAGQDEVHEVSLPKISRLWRDLS